MAVVLAFFLFLDPFLGISFLMSYFMKMFFYWRKNESFLLFINDRVCLFGYKKNKSLPHLNAFYFEENNKFKKKKILDQ